MSETTTTGQPIAWRTYEIVPDQEAVLKVFAPVPDEDDWRCNYEIHWPDRIRRFYTMGVDPMQALVSAIGIARSELCGSPEYKAGRLAWFGEPEMGLGLPDLPSRVAPPVDQIGS